jgi:hypothetical protein
VDTAVNISMKSPPSPISLSTLDVALLASLSANTKVGIAKDAVELLEDRDIDIMKALVALQRLIDLKITQQFGDGYLITPAGARAVVAYKARLERVLKKI